MKNGPILLGINFGFIGSYRMVLATFRCRNNKLSVEIQAWGIGGKW
jgi:hypothetical protein